MTSRTFQFGWLGACLGAAFFASSLVEASAASLSPCAQMTFENARYTVCEAPLRHYSIRMYWQRPDGKPYNFLSSLPKTTETGEPLAFALNGGMFHPDYAPVGLYVEKGRELKSANTNSGPGNFHLKPNGVFYADGATAGVMETGAFLKAQPKASFATQSGPMLVIDGRLHPRLRKANASAKERDGVCVKDHATVVFAISEEGVAFDAFMRLFRDRLRCQNALFLDGGSAPALYEPQGQHGGNTFVSLGPMIAVYAKK